MAGTLDFTFCGTRPLRTSWLIVGIKDFTLLEPQREKVKVQRKAALPGALPRRREPQAARAALAARAPRLRGGARTENTPPRRQRPGYFDGLSLG